MTWADLHPNGFPGVVELDLALEHPGRTRQATGSATGSADPLEIPAESFLPETHFPALRRLDLSRNEPGFSGPRWLGGNVSIYGLLRSLRVRRQLTHLSVPSIRSMTDAESLQIALDDMPALVELRVSNNYSARSHFSHPSARLDIPAQWPWQPRDQVQDGAAVMLELPGSLGTVMLSVLEGVIAMERTFNNLPDHARTAYTEFWTLVRNLDHAANAESTRLPMTTLVDMMRSSADTFHDDSWRKLAAVMREQVGPQSTDAVVLIRRVDRPNL